MNNHTREILKNKKRYKHWKDWNYGKYTKKDATNV